MQPLRIAQLHVRPRSRGERRPGRQHGRAGANLRQQVRISRASRHVRGWTSSDECPVTTAWDALDGVTWLVVPSSLGGGCDCRYTVPPGTRAVPIALACNVSTAIPGSYRLTYTATNSAGLTSAVNRTLIVRTSCPAGEAVCEDKVSQGGRAVHQPFGQHCRPAGIQYQPCRHAQMHARVQTLVHACLRRAPGWG